MGKKVAKTVSLYLYEKQKQMLDELKDRIPISKSAIIRIAIRHLHREKCEENVEKF